MWMLFVLGWLGAPAVEMKVTPLAGQPVIGALVELSADKIVLRTADGERSFATQDVLSLTRLPEAGEPDGGAKVRVEFADGSQALAEAFSVVEGKAVVQLLGGPAVETRTRSIKSVRFQAPSAAVDAQWQDSVAGRRDGDQIVIRKMARSANDDKNEIVLDRLTGIIQDVGPEVVKFEFEGDKIDVRREKLEGIIYFQGAGRELPEPQCRITDRAGGRWNAKSARWTGERFEVETAVGVTFSLPAADVRKLDYSVANTVFLSDLEADAVEFTPYFESKAIAAKLAQQFQPRRDASFDGSKLLLRGQSYEKGLALHSRTTMTFRLPRDARRFLAVAGIDDRVQDAGNVRLVISGDGKTKFDREIAGRDEAVDIGLDVAGVRRLTVLVDFGSGLDFGDHLNLCNARITK